MRDWGEPGDLRRPNPGIPRWPDAIPTPCLAPRPRQCCLRYAGIVATP